MMCWMIDYYVYYTTNTRGAGIIHHLTSMIQGSRPGATGGIPGRAPPKWLLVPPPPKRGLCHEEINRLGATGVQIEAQIGVFCGLTPDIMTFLGWRPFFGDHPFSTGKTAWISNFGRKIPCKFGENLFFFFGDHLFSAGKSLANLEKTFFCFWRSPAKNRLNFRFRPKNPFESLLLTLFIWSRLG